MRTPWDPYNLFGEEPVILARRQAMETAIAIEEAADELLVPSATVLLFDLRTGMTTRIVAMPVVMHRHGQDCCRG